MSWFRTTDLYRIFNMLDKNGDGLVSLEDLMWLLDSIGVQTRLEELKLLVGKDDLDPIDFVLFHDLVIKGNNNNNNVGGGDKGKRSPETREHYDPLRIIGEKDLRKAFEVFDSDRDGFISCEELKSALCRLGLWDDERYCGKDYCRTMINVYDTNCDGKLDFEEFKNMMLV